MPTTDDGNASSTDTHPLLVHHDDHPDKKIDEVAVVDAVVHESPTFAPDSSKDVSTVAESSRGPSLGTVVDQHSEVASVHSVPEVRITESPIPMLYESQASPLPSPSPSTLSHRPPPSPTRSQTLQEPSSIPTGQQRRSSRRSTIEVCSQLIYVHFCINIGYRVVLPTVSLAFSQTS